MLNAQGVRVDESAMDLTALKIQERLGPFESDKGNTYIYFMRVYLEDIFPGNNYKHNKKKIIEESRNYTSRIIANHPGIEHVAIIVPEVFYEEVSKVDVEIAGKFKVYDERSVSFDPTESIYVPKHELASEEEIDDM